ncbi:MAG: NAD-dependent epimerase/dehydratase family protein [Acidimicrobiia bacterium]
MKVLVTGAAGFLGGHVVERLLRDGFEVTAFDQRPFGGEARSIVGDLVDPEAMKEAVAGHDSVCHVGAIGDVYLAASQPALAAAVNVTGSTNVAEAARQAGAKVVYASTWEVYGQPRYEPLDEDHPCSPDHPYSITKLAGERMLLAADHLLGVPVLALRLGTAYGSGLRPNSVFRIFIDKARRREPITIQGDGSQARQFTHAHDIARAFSLACRVEAHGLVLNTVAAESISVKQLAEAVIARYPTDLSFGPARPGDVPPAVISSSRIQELLGWSAEISFEAGISELIESMPEPA